MSKGRGIHRTLVFLLILVGVAGARFAWMGLMTSGSTPFPCWPCYAFLHHVHIHGNSNERSTVGALRTIVSAQRDFRDNDRDHNGLRDYWRADVASLYYLRPQGDGAPSDMIRLIEQSVALADSAPKPPAEAAPIAKSGYFFKALLHSDESAPGPDRFTVGAYPAIPQSGRFVFILDESGDVYLAEFQRVGIPARYPSKEERTLNWDKYDWSRGYQKLPP